MRLDISESAHTGFGSPLHVLDSGGHASGHGSAAGNRVIRLPADVVEPSRVLDQVMKRLRSND